MLKYQKQLNLVLYLGISLELLDRILNKELFRFEGIFTLAFAVIVLLALHFYKKKNLTTEEKVLESVESEQRIHHEESQK